MKDRARIADGLGKALLASMAVDEPSEEARRRTAAVLGLRLSGPPTDSGPRTPPRELPTTRSGRLFRLFRTSKWAGGAGLAGAMAAAGSLVVALHAPSRFSESPPTAPLVVEPLDVRAPRIESDEVTPAPQPRPVPPPPRRHPASRAPTQIKGAARLSVVPALPAPPVQDPVRDPVPDDAKSGPEKILDPTLDEGFSGLSAETTLLESVRDALEAHSPRAGALLLTRYDRSFPNGVLRAEADALRVEATLRSGDRAGGEALAARFLEKHGDSALAARVRALLEKTPDQKESSPH